VLQVLDGSGPGKAPLPARAISVRLPVRLEGLDGLTKAASREAGLVDLTGIFLVKVDPPKLACGPSYSVLVYGAELWRNPRLYLNGVPHSDLTVLPDMQGLSVSFNAGGSLPRWSRPGKAQLQIFTSGGSAIKELDVESNCEKTSAAAGRVTEIRTRSLRFIPGEKLALEVVTGTLEGPMSEFKVALRPKSDGSPYKWVESQALTPERDEKALIGDIPALPLTDRDAGAPLQAAMRLYERPLREPLTVIAPQTVTYYPSQDAAKIRLKTSAIADIADPVTLVLPKNALAAFPNLGATPSIKAVAGSGAEAVTLQGTLAAGSGDERTLQLTAVTPTDKARYDEKHKKADLTFRLEFVNVAGTADQPSFSGDLTIRQAK
jgi:hypothetical protein